MPSDPIMSYWRLVANTKHSLLPCNAVVFGGRANMRACPRNFISGLPMAELQSETDLAVTLAVHELVMMYY
jgi:hypothetical protein